MDIRQALYTVPWDLIALIGRHHHLGIDSNLPKTALIEKVAAKLLDSVSWPDILAAIPDPDRRCLLTLQLAGGRLPAHHLTRRFGSRRTHRALIRACRQQAPLTPVERLQIAGLVFLDLSPPIPDLYIPSDLLALLPPPAANLPPPPASPLTAGSALIYDTACLLALLHSHDIVPQHKRWLPPRFLILWASLSATPAQNPAPHSELQTNRRRFLHYLAELAGWLPPASSTPLKPSPRAWQWLNDSPVQQLETLRQTWLSPQPELWRVYRLPGYRWLTHPDRLVTAIYHWLPRLPSAPPAETAQILLDHQPDLLGLVPAALPEPETVLTDAIRQILTGPLHWLAATGSDRDRAWGKFSLSADGPQQNHFILRSTRDLPAPSALMTALELGRIHQANGPQTSFIIDAAAFSRGLHRRGSPSALSVSRRTATSGEAVSSAGSGDCFAFYDGSQ